MTLRAAGPDLVALLGFAGLVLFQHAQGLVGGPVGYGSDTVLFQYPVLKWIANQLQSGEYPLWLPGIFTGYPILADGQFGLLYPVKVWLLWSCGAECGIVWLRILHLFLAAVFMHLYCRKVLRTGVIAASGAAIVFTFGSFLAEHLQHENTVESAVWLPLVLTFVAFAWTSHGPRRSAWCACAALALSQSALAVHIGPVLMISLVVLFDIAFRLAFSASLREARAAVLVLTGVFGGALTAAAAQLLPLYELGQQSFRAEGVDYSFASAFSLGPADLATLLLPYFFRLADASNWWSLWAHWETTLYVGVPTLSLLIIGLLQSGRRHALYFGLLAVLGLWLCLADNAPVVNLHRLLWMLPGFSILRAPARFSLIVVFAFASLAALGLQILMLDQRPRARVRTLFVGALPPAFVLACSIAGFPVIRTWLGSNPAAAAALIQTTYLSARAGEPLTVDTTLAGLSNSLDLASVKTAWSMLLLGLTVVLVVLWFRSPRIPTGTWCVAFVALIAVDLSIFGADFYPQAPLASLNAMLPPQVPAGARLELHGTTSLQPNQLLSAGFATVEGFSGIPPEGYLELLARAEQQPELLSLFSAPFIVEPIDPPDLASVAGVRLRLEHALSGGYLGAKPTLFHVPRDVATNSGLIVRSILVVESTEGHNDGGPLAAITASGTNGTCAMATLLVGGVVDIPVPDSCHPVTIGVQPLSSVAFVRFQGIGLVSTDGTVYYSMTLADRDGVQVVAHAAEYTILQDALAPARAFVEDRANVVAASARPDEIPLRIVPGPNFDVRTQTLIEGAEAAASTDRSAAVRSHATVEEHGPNDLRIIASTDRPAYLVVNDQFYDGWLARVDGRSAPVQIANAVFRAVPLESGSHVVELSFRPLSHLFGAVISLTAGVVLLSIAVRGMLRP